MIRLEREDTLPQSPLEESDLIVEISTYLDLVSLVAFFHTSGLIMRSLHRRTLLSKHEMCEYAAREGHLDLMLWARENRCLFYWLPCATVAMESDRMHILDWIQINSPDFSTRLLWHPAVRSGRLECVQWLAKRESPVITCHGTSLCDWAAQFGHLECLKWLRENGAPWGPSTCCMAAQWGYLHILKWARENGCPWDRSDVFNAVLEWEHYEVTDWLTNSKFS
jgi:hypothetical protein